jgi:hypothetical protein
MSRKCKNTGSFYYMEDENVPQAVLLEDPHPVYLGLQGGLS